MPTDNLYPAWLQEFAIKWLTEARDKQLDGYRKGFAIQVARSGKVPTLETLLTGDPRNHDNGIIYDSIRKANYREALNYDPTRYQNDIAALTLQARYCSHEILAQRAMHRI